MSGRGRPGRPSRGPRTQTTVRFPDPLYALLVEEYEASGYASFGDFVVAELAGKRAEKLAARGLPGQLPIGA